MEAGLIKRILLSGSRIFYNIYNIYFATNCTRRIVLRRIVREPPWKATVLKCWIVADRLWNKKIISRASPVVVESRLPVSDKMSRPSLLRGLQVSTLIGTNVYRPSSSLYLVSFLAMAISAAAAVSWMYYYHHHHHHHCYSQLIPLLFGMHYLWRYCYCQWGTVTVP